jgi:hypothetical protein
MKLNFWKVTIIVTTSLSFGVGLGQGCSRPYTSSSSSSSSPADAYLTEAGYKINPDIETVGLTYSKQILDHLVSCSGIGVPTDATQSTWLSKKGAVSVDGAVDTLTAPMLMASATIAGDVCRDLIDQEEKADTDTDSQTEARIFTGVNWSTSTPLPSTGVLTTSIQGLALSCWQRQAESAELDLILQAVQSEFGSGNINTREAYLFLCASMLGSIDTLAL